MQFDSWYITVIFINDLVENCMTRPIRTRALAEQLPYLITETLTDGPLHRWRENLFDLLAMLDLNDGSSLAPVNTTIFTITS